MKRILLGLLVPLFMGQIYAYGQFNGPSLLTQSKDEREAGNDLVLATRTITALKRLDAEVMVYRSLGDFEVDGRLARVPFDVFKKDLQEVTAEVGFRSGRQIRAYGRRRTCLPPNARIDPQAVGL
jgi:hypothetical protein